MAHRPAVAVILALMLAFDLYEALVEHQWGMLAGYVFALAIVALRKGRDTPAQTTPGQPQEAPMPATDKRALALPAVTRILRCECGHDNTGHHYGVGRCLAEVDETFWGGTIHRCRCTQLAAVAHVRTGEEPLPIPAVRANAADYAMMLAMGWSYEEFLSLEPDQVAYVRESLAAMPLDRP